MIIIYLQLVLLLFKMLGKLIALLLVLFITFSIFMIGKGVQDEINEVGSFLKTFTPELPKNCTSTNDECINNAKIYTNYNNLFKCLHDTIENTNESFDVAIIGNCSKYMYLLVKYNLLNYKSSNNRYFNLLQKDLKNILLDNFIDDFKLELINTIDYAEKLFNCIIVNQTGIECNYDEEVKQFELHSNNLFDKMNNSVLQYQTDRYVVVNKTNGNKTKIYLLK